MIQKMLLATDYLTAKVLQKIKICYLCKSKPGKLFKFVSHNGQRIDYCCGYCIKKLGRPNIQQILEDMPLPQVQTNFFKKTSARKHESGCPARVYNHPDAQEEDHCLICGGI